MRRRMRRRRSGRHRSERGWTKEDGGKVQRRKEKRKREATILSHPSNRTSWKAGTRIHLRSKQGPSRGMP
jgi:hypothetical protein